MLEEPFLEKDDVAELGGSPAFLEEFPATAGGWACGIRFRGITEGSAALT
jgi:hypothetical protein